MDFETSGPALYDDVDKVPNKTLGNCQTRNSEGNDNNKVVRPSPDMNGDIRPALAPTLAALSNGPRETLGSVGQGCNFVRAHNERSDDSKGHIIVFVVNVDTWKRLRSA